MAERRPIDVAVRKFYGAIFITTVVIFGLVALWVGTTQSDTRGFPYLNVAFVASWLVAIVITVCILEYAKRRPDDGKVTWGEAFVGATIVFFLMFWVWGVVPHQWLTFADNELAWRADKALVGPSFGFTNGEGILTWAIPFDLSYLVVRDIIVVVIYGATIAAFVALWGIWQSWGKVAPATVPESTYGRPLVKEGV